MSWTQLRVFLSISLTCKLLRLRMSEYGRKILNTQLICDYYFNLSFSHSISHPLFALIIKNSLFEFEKIYNAVIYLVLNSQLACLSGANGCYVRHISSGAPKRSHFASSRRQTSGSNHINEISSIGANGSAKKRVSS